MRGSRRMHGVIAAVVGITVFVAACSKDSTGPGNSGDPGNGVAVVLKGTLVGVTLSGDIDITIAATGSATSLPITGCLYLRSASCVAVTGAYTIGTKALVFTTSGPSLSFNGTYSGGQVDGGFSGSESGDWVARTGTATVYCGTFAGDASGTWNFVISGGTLDGIYDDGSGGNALSGTVSGNNLSITFAGGTATGTLGGASASGTWSAPPDNGTWSGSNVGCRS